MSRVRRAAGLLVAPSLLVACNAILGTRDLTFDDGDAGIAADGAAPTIDAHAPDDARTEADGSITPPDDGGTRTEDADAAPTTCTADLQKDEANCGACGHACLGGACVSGACQPVTLAAGLSNPAGIAVDATHVYYATYGGYTIEKVAKSGGAATILAHDVAGNVSAPWGIALDDANVYWVNHELDAHSSPDDPGRVARCAKSGCNQVGTNVVSNLSYPEDLAVDGTSVYWVEAYGHKAGRAGKSDGAGAGALAAFDDQALAIALDDTHVYFATESTLGRVAKGAKVADGGGPFETLYTTNQLSPGCIAVDGTRVWMTLLDDPGVVQFLPKGDAGAAAAPTPFATEQVSPYGIAVDATNVYWTSFGKVTKTASGDSFLDGTVSTCPKTGCPASGPVVLASKLRHPSRITVDDAAIYWTSFGDPQVDHQGSVMMLAKPSR